MVAAAACVAGSLAVITPPTTVSAFVVTPPLAALTSHPRRLLPHSSSSSSSGRNRWNNSALNAFARQSQSHVCSSFSGKTTAAGGGRVRPRHHVTRTHMAFSGGGGGGKGPLGFSFGTLAAIGFGLLLLFAPGFIFGAFNTIFLVKLILGYMKSRTQPTVCCSQNGSFPFVYLQYGSINSRILEL